MLCLYRVTVIGSCAECKYDSYDFAIGIMLTGDNFKDSGIQRACDCCGEWASAIAHETASRQIADIERLGVAVGTGAYSGSINVLKVTNFTPYRLAFGREINLPINLERRILIRLVEFELSPKKLLKTSINLTE